MERDVELRVINVEGSAAGDCTGGSGKVCPVDLKRLRAVEECSREIGSYRELPFRHLAGRYGKYIEAGLRVGEWPLPGQGDRASGEASKVQFRKRELPGGGGFGKLRQLYAGNAEVHRADLIRYVAPVLNLALAFHRSAKRSCGDGAVRHLVGVDGVVRLAIHAVDADVAIAVAEVAELQRARGCRSVHCELRVALQLQCSGGQVAETSGGGKLRNTDTRLVIQRGS